MNLIIDKRDTTRKEKTMNKMTSTKLIPAELKSTIEEWLKRIYGQSSCYGNILTFRDFGIEDDSQREIFRKSFTDREACIKECVGEWRSLNPQTDFGIYFRFHSFSLGQTAFYNKFKFLPYIKDLREIFGKIFDDDPERIEAIENLNKACSK